MSPVLFYHYSGFHYIIYGQVYPGHLSWFLKKNCPYTEVVSSALTRLVEAGMVDRFYSRHMVKSLGKREAGSDRVRFGF